MAKATGEPQAATQQTPTNRIAEAAGVGVGTVYEYFADKEAVFDALIRRELAALVSAVEALELSDDAKEWLAAEGFEHDV